MSDWKSIDEAATYVGLGKTVLYAMAKEGRIPSSKVAQKWLFNKNDLDAWIRANKPMEDFFTTIDFNIEENPQLREPQINAYNSIYDYFNSGNKVAIVQIPVGCGKSGLAAIIPFGIAKGRVLVVTPNLTIMKGMFETFDITNRQKCFWSKRGVLKKENLISGPYACTLSSGNISIAKKSHIVITNIHQLSTNVDKWLNKFSDDFFDLIIIDEAHHSAAKSWEQILEKFPNAKVINMTATPFRSDSQEIKGELIFRYHLKGQLLWAMLRKFKLGMLHQVN